MTTEPTDEQIDMAEVWRALSLLVHASRISPPLRDAVGVVEREIVQLREMLAEATAAVIWMSGLGPIPDEATHWQTIRDQQLPRWLSAIGEAE